MMNQTPLFASARRLVRAALVSSVATLASGAALAVDPPLSPTESMQLGGGTSAAARRMDLSIGRSVVVDLPRDAKEVFVANPGVANAVVRSARKIFLIGIANGATSMFVMDADGRQIASIDVNVGRDLNVLRQTLRTTLPKAQIDVRPAGDSVLLTGLVGSAGEAQQAVDIAKAFVGQSTAAVPSAGSGGVSIGVSTTVSGSVINGLTIAGRDQVMLRVSVIEVDRSVVKQLGISTSGTWSTFGLATQAAFPLQTQSLASLNAIGGTVLGGNGGTNNIGATLNAFERARVSRVLAEPTLVAISGESATFTAGGEVPVPSDAQCAVSTTAVGGVAGGVPVCVPSVTFKPYGINLAFTPVVLSEGRISMRVNTEVTEIDPENQIRIGSISVPSFRVRKSTTSVELPSGATMMTAGLLSNQMGHAVSGLPGLINLPILGALFRSRDYQRRETELMIMVSPFIAKPMEAAQAKRPDDGFVETSDPQAVLLGRLNKIYGVAGPAAAATGRYTGRFGFITD